MIFRYLTISKTPGHDLLEMLNNNVIGTPGQSMLYQHTQVNQKLHQINAPYFANLIRTRKIAGTCCFCSRETLNNGAIIQSFYIRYFSFKNIFRRKSMSARVSGRNSSLRGEVEALLNGEGLEVQGNEKFFHYAYVDPRNERSAVLCKEFGFEVVRQYTTVLFSRLKPKPGLNKIVEVNAESIHELLKDFYKGHNMLSFENLSGKKYYFIENEKGQRVAGVQVNPDQWKIHSLPGFLTNLLLGIFTHVPFLNRLLNKKFRFLTLEGIYVFPGHEKYLEQLIESLLEKHNVYTALCVVDPESKLYTSLKSMQLGLMSKLNREVRGHVICRFKNFSEEEKAVFRKNPVYISGIDAT